MRTLLLVALFFLACTGVAAGQGGGRGAGASAAATVGVQVVVAGGVAFSWDQAAGAAPAAANGRRVVERGGAPEPLLQVWRSQAAPKLTQPPRELVAEGQLGLPRDGSTGGRGERSSRLDAALAAAAREPRRYTVAVIY